MLIIFHPVNFTLDCRMIKLYTALLLVMLVLEMDTIPEKKAIAPPPYLALLFVSAGADPGKMKGGG